MFQVISLFKPFLCFFSILCRSLIKDNIKINVSFTSNRCVQVVTINHIITSRSSRGFRTKTSLVLTHFYFHRREITSHELWMKSKKRKTHCRSLPRLSPCSETFCGLRPLWQPRPPYSFRRVGAKCRNSIGTNSSYNTVLTLTTCFSYTALCLYWVKSLVGRFLDLFLSLIENNIISGSKCKNIIKKESCMIKKNSCELKLMYLFYIFHHNTYTKIVLLSRSI